MVGLGLFNIIIVEDSTELPQGLEDHLSQQGFRALMLETGEGLSSVANAMAPGAIRLDLYLPNEDGMDIVKRVKPACSGFGVKVLTARVRNIDRILAYEADADVCLTKQAGVAEVCTVLKSICRRIAPQYRIKNGFWICAAIAFCRRAGTSLNSRDANVCCS